MAKTAWLTKTCNKISLSSVMSLPLKRSYYEKAAALHSSWTFKGLLNHLLSWTFKSPSYQNLVQFLIIISHVSFFFICAFLCAFLPGLKWAGKKWCHILTCTNENLAHLHQNITTASGNLLGCEVKPVQKSKAPWTATVYRMSQSPYGLMFKCPSSQQK